MRTSTGAALIFIDTGYSRDEILIETIGPGSLEAETLALSMLGLGDNPPHIHSEDPAVVRANSRFGALRLGASRDAYHELLPAVLGQRITAADAARQWRRLCEVFGSPAPDCDGAPSLVLPPEPAELASATYWRLHSLGIERRRAETLRAVARHFEFLRRLEPESVLPTAQLLRVPGVGIWTAAVAGFLAFGDSDALCVGDFHAKNTVTYAFTGRHRGSDDEMCALLAPYSPHRARVLRWLELDGWNAPAHGPRRRNLNIAHL